VALSAIDTIGPAFQRMKRQLFQPFRFGQWVRYAFVGLLAGEMGTAGGCNLQFPFNLPSQEPRRFQLPLPATDRDLLFVVALGFLVVLVVIAAVLLLYVSSRMRFVLFDSIVAGECQISRFWNARGEPAWRYFVWQILFLLCSIAAFSVVVGIPLAVAAVSGVFRDPRGHLVVLIVGGILVGLTVFLLVLSTAVIHVLTKDFVVPQMAFEDISAVEGWRRVWPIIKSQSGSFAGYIGLKIVLAIGTAILITIAIFIVLFALLIPIGVIGALLYLWSRSVALAWNPLTVTLAVLAGVVILIVFLILCALISVPAIVFFPSYSIHYFADRYAPLRNALFPAAPPDATIT
jgi:hypothetical protein